MPLPEGVCPDVGARAVGLLPHRQGLEEVLLEHEELTQEFLEELAALEEAPPLSDEELARQALAAGGEDGDIKTPE